MTSPVLVVINYDLHIGGSGSEVSVFKDIKNTINYGKERANEYLKDYDLTRDSFAHEWDEFEEEECEKRYTLTSYKAHKEDTFNIMVYRQPFEDVA